MEIQNLQKERGAEASPERWCIRCRMNGHTKDNCPQAGVPSSLCPREVAGPRGLALWCNACRISGLHDKNHCPYLAACVPEVKQQWCRFYKSVGHDEQNCRMYDLMIDRGNLYRVQSDPSSPRSLSSAGGSPARGRGGRRGGSENRGRGKLICYNCGEVGHFSRD